MAICRWPPRLWLPHASACWLSMVQGIQGLEAIVGALSVVRGLEDSIRETTPARALRRNRGRWRAVGGVAAKNSYRAADDPMTLYQDPLSLPHWIRGPRLRDALMRLGAVLDGVRLLHDAQIEWSVLLFTMWARLVLVWQIRDKANKILAATGRALFQGSGHLTSLARFALEHGNVWIPIEYRK
jgi:hypothetical protein